jgi:hypothetical protein
VCGLRGGHPLALQEPQDGTRHGFSLLGRDEAAGSALDAQTEGLLTYESCLRSRLTGAAESA